MGAELGRIGALKMVERNGNSDQPHDREERRGQLVERDAYPVFEACQLLGNISRTTFYELKRSGALRTFLLGTKRLVSRQAILDLIRELEQESND